MTARHATIVAWQFDADDYEGGACVVFARTALGAARLVRFQDGFDGYDRRDMDERVSDMRRVPEFDCHAPGPVPMSALLAAGWWYTCSHCEHRVSEEGCWKCAEEAESETYPDPIIDDAAGEVWCSQACKDAEAAERRARKEREEATRVACRAALPLWPDLEIVHVWGGMRTGEESVELRLPGIVNRVTWRASEPGVLWIAQMDVETYQRLRDERRARAAAREPCAGCGDGTLANKLGGLCGDVAEDAGVACPNRARKEKAT